MIKTVKDRFNNSYAKPTPAKWRKLGDSLLGVSSMFTGYAIMDDMKWLALTSLTIGVIGKFLSDFFKEE